MQIKGVAKFYWWLWFCQKLAEEKRGRLGHLCVVLGGEPRYWWTRVTGSRWQIVKSLSSYTRSSCSQKVKTASKRCKQSHPWQISNESLKERAMFKVTSWSLRLAMKLFPATAPLVTRSPDGGPCSTGVLCRVFCLTGVNSQNNSHPHSRIDTAQGS